MTRRDFTTLLAVWLLVSVPFGGSLAAQPPPRSVLIIDEVGPGLPWYVALSSAFQSTLNASSPTSVAIYAENLDLNRFDSPEYEETLRDYFHSKYQGKKISVIVASGSSALDYVLRWRAELWPGVPMVFAAVSAAVAAKLNLPPDVTGSTMRHTLVDAVSTARMLVPNLKRIALVGDPLERKSFWHEFKDEIPIVTTDLDLIGLTGLPMTEVRSRAATLPDETAIVYTGIYIDGAGFGFVPRDALVAIAEVANRPIVVDAGTFIGYGGVGGFIVDPGAIGQNAAELTLRILNGEKASNIPVIKGDFTKPIFDWRQLQRFGISEAQLPPGSEIRFRNPTAWEQYRWQIILIVAALLIQTTLIIRLFYERRHRRNAEAASRSAMGNLADLNRVATATELAAAIAHEVSQPLAAMVTGASAGLRWLENKTPDLDQARSAIKNVVTAGHRAGEVIESIRAMFKKYRQEKSPVELNDVIRDVLALLREELQTRRILVQTQIANPLPLVLGQSGQLQQVILNLVRNAADAMDSVSGRARVLRVKTAIHNPDGVLVSVEDSGTGVDPNDIDRIFKTFFTTKSQGMGMGLSICRSIIEAHDGKLWASSGAENGSVFNILLPAIRLPQWTARQRQ